MAKNLKNWSGTSFFDITVECTVNKLKDLFGEADEHIEDIDEESQYNWYLQTEKGSFFCIYDWKEYREFEEDEYITWHIGNKKEDIEDIKEYLKQINLLK